MPLTELVYFVTITFTITNQTVQLHHNNVPANSTTLVQAFSGKASYHPDLSAPTAQTDLAPCNLGLFPKLKLPLKERRFVNALVTRYTSSVNGVSLPID